MASSARIDELLKKFDENPRRYFAPLANEYRKAGDVQRAIELCREHLPQQPGHMSGHIVYGQALFEARDFDEARQVFEEALRLDPENLIALRHLGDIARDHGDVVAARDWYQRVLDADPRNEEIAAQIASLSSPEAPEAQHAAAEAGADATTAPMLDTDLVADIAAGVAEPPAEARREATAAAPATPAEESHFLDDALLGATFDGRTASAPSGESTAPEPPADFTGTIDLPAAAEREAAASTAGAEDDLGLDFDAMEGTAASGGGREARDDLDLDLESIGGAPVARDESAPREEAALTELPTEELSISDLSRFAAADESRFGEIQLGEEAAARRDSAASLELDEALADSGLAPTPAGGTDATPPREAGSADFSDFALAESPAEGSRAGQEVADRGAQVDAGAPTSATRPAEVVDASASETSAAAGAGGGETSEGYSLGRLAGLEPMEFVPPDAAATKDAYDDPTFGRTLREDAPPAAATPAAFVTETMAELYLQQGFHDEALAVYRQLLEQHPNDANLRERVAQLESGSVSALSAAAVSSSVIEAAQQRGAAQGGRSVRSFFASLASRRAPARPADAGTDRESPAGGGGEEASAAEATAADAYVEAIGEGYDREPGSDASAVSDSTRAPSFDEFGFPEVGRSAPTDRQGHDVTKAAAEGEEAVGAELPDSAAIEPATLDYLAHEGATAAEAGVVSEGEAGAPAQPADAAAPAGPVDTLFDGAAVNSRDEAAAATLADAFGPPSAPPRAPTGEARRVPTPGSGAVPARDARTPATRPAARELSLDDVFRETPRRSGSVRREAGGPTFSFDQFFAEGSGGGTSGASKSEPSASGEAPRADAQPSGDDSSSADIEQFNAWLEGLKKK